MYFIIPKKWLWLRNLWLLLSSVVFYAWGEPLYVLLMLAQVFSGWFFGLLIHRFRANRRLARLALIGSLVVGFSSLIFFKYSDFLISNLNAAGLDIALLKLALPLGISFYTFQTLSYTMDLYMGNTKVQYNPLTFATYVMLFPQLIAGPIVRYVDVENELKHREHSINLFGAGVRRFIIGLGKKVLLANVLGELVKIYKDSGEKTLLFTWLYLIAYSLHIYFDFSGYSDMAIGMGKMFGFKFLENFNYPYISRSITEFWRRWHISLSTWFRDYVYIPLGGNRVKLWRHIFNIFIVWLLTGFWHGAGWNFILWGVYFAVLLLLEKFVLAKLLKRIPKVFGHAYTLLFLLISWTLFDSESLRETGAALLRMFDFSSAENLGIEGLYYLKSYAVIIIIGIIGATPLPKKITAKLEASQGGEKALLAGEVLFLSGILLMVTANLVDGSFNPFIYFRF
jgi:alginate O-acetyltransferase complex protein AlgI